MANYSLVVNSSFKPFSYQEMLSPVLMATQAHQELENQYGELATKANVWEEMANEQTDPYAYKMYKKYANDLEEQAGQLAREGLSAVSRRNILNMKSRYSSEITPIEQAYAARQKQAEQQQEALLKDPTLILSRRAATTSLDDYIKNPQLAYDAYSGKMLTAQVASAAGALAKEMQNNPRKWRNILGNSYYETMMQKGFSSDAVLKAVQGNPDAAKELTSIVEDVISSSGIRNWGDQAIMDRAYDYARQGLWSAVGETQYQTLENWRAKMDETDRRKGIQAEQARLNSLAINPLNIYSNRELSISEKDYKDSIQKYSKYFEKKNGKWTMNEAGWKEYNRSTGESKKTGPLGVSGRAASSQVRGENPDHTEFRRFMDSMGITMSSESFDSSQGEAAGTIWGDYAKESPMAKTARYDATKVTEFDYPIAGAQQVDMKDAIMTAGRGTTLKEVDYDSKSKQFKDTGEEITMEDLKSDKYKVTATRFSPYGSTVMIQDDKGNVRRFRMPAGINTYNEGFRDAMMADVLEYQELLKNPNLSVSDRLAYQDAYKEAIQKAYLYHSQLGVQNKTKEQEFNPYGY